ncbi:MAG: YbaY family lipoprotein [Euryarchaeota archaeon]|nr:YbaY family lipoprotein [Euryarchaeota archaeon]
MKMKNTYTTLLILLALGTLAASALTMGCTDGTNSMIQGEIVFEEVNDPIRDATIYIELEDVSLADAPSTVISSMVLENVNIDADGSASIPYSLEYPELDDRLTYSMSVLVDLNGDGRTSGGDYISMEHIPVSTSGPNDNITINARFVTPSDDGPQPVETTATVVSLEDLEDSTKILLDEDDVECGEGYPGDLYLIVNGQTVIQYNNGVQLSLDDIFPGTRIRAYYGPAVMLSMPPQSVATLIVVLPDTQNTDGTDPGSTTLEATITDVMDIDNDTRILIQGDEVSEFGFDCGIYLIVSDQTSIIDETGTVLSMDTLVNDTAVRTTMGPAMTRSLPPIGQAEEIVVLSE